MRLTINAIVVPESINRVLQYLHWREGCCKKLVNFYNVANGVLFCFLAGSMITVSATAVGVPTGLDMPKLTDVMPNSITWIIVVLIIGGLTTWIAAKGYGMVSQAANWMSPVIVLAFLVCGVVASNQLGIQSFSDFIAINLY